VLRRNVSLKDLFDASLVVIDWIYLILRFVLICHLKRKCNAN
jgi:hypothetical protein